MRVSGCRFPTSSSVGTLARCFVRSQKPYSPRSATLFRSRGALVAENTLLRQQVLLLHRATPHPRLKARDRFTIGAITKLFPSLVAAVPIVRPDTVIRWHRSLWKLIWRRRSRRPVGRPPIDADTRALIRRMWTENPLWGEDVIAAELAKLGHHVSPRTVAKYRPARLPRGRGQKWSTFIRNHLGQTWAADWFTIVTVRFEILYAFVILDLGRREILRVGVTSTPSAQYAAQSFVEAVCDRDDQAPRFLIHDRDSIYGTWFRRRVKGFGTRCLATPPSVASGPEGYPFQRNQREPGAHPKPPLSREAVRAHNAGTLVSSMCIAAASA